MKKIEMSEQLKRAFTVIKADRLGVSAGIESIIACEVRKVLEDFFCVDGEIKTFVEVNERGFVITIKASATSIKQVNVIE